MSIYLFCSFLSSVVSKKQIQTDRLLVTKHSVVKQRILEMHKKFVLRSDYRRQNRIFLGGDYMVNFSPVSRAEISVRVLKEILLK